MVHFFLSNPRPRQKISWILVQLILVYSGLNDYSFGLFSLLSFESKHCRSKKRSNCGFLDTPSSNSTTVLLLVLFPLDHICTTFFSLFPYLTPPNRHPTSNTQLKQSSSFIHEVFSLVSYHTYRNTDS